MAITINHATKVISIPQVDLTFISGSLYELNVNSFRNTLKGLEDDEQGMTLLDTHKHNTEVTVGGVTLARVVEIINGYTITFQDGQYAVRLVGGNNNIGDVMNLNQVSLRTQNTAGLLVSGSGVTAQDKVDIIDGVYAQGVAVLGPGAIDIGTIASAEELNLADVLLNRNLAAGVDSGTESLRTVRQALRMLRNLVQIVDNVITVTKENDIDVSWAGIVQKDAGGHLTAINPHDS